MKSNYNSKNAKKSKRYISREELVNKHSGNFITKTLPTLKEESFLNSAWKLLKNIFTKS